MLRVRHETLKVRNTNYLYCGGFILLCPSPLSGGEGGDMPHRPPADAYRGNKGRAGRNFQSEESRLKMEKYEAPFAVKEEPV